MVIQRWQSVMLLITAILMACFTFLSIGQVQTPVQSLDFTTLGFDIEGSSTGGAPSGMEQYTWGFFIVSLLSFIIPLLDIFLYKNLRYQRMLCRVEIVFILGVIAIGAVYGYYIFAPYHVSWSSMIIAPFISLVSTYLAWKLIGRDMRTLRNSERFI